ncbi:MAG TPA: branched-chain amino acid ABC transporter permease, partial [Caldimonas sp.]
MAPGAEDLAMPAGATVAPLPPVARSGGGRAGLIAVSLGAFAVLAAAGWVFPRWLTFLLTMAAGNGLVSLGIVGLMRGGVVPFGQGMVFAAGGYAAALAYNKLGFTDAIGLTLAGGVAAMLVAAPFAPLLSRYRGIFFAMLTLALSMVTYGLLMKLDTLGGSDGFNVGRPTLLGWKLPDAHVGYILYLLTVSVATLATALMRIAFDSTRGLVTLAVRENELRVEYLGGSVRRAMAINFAVAAFCGGLGGALVVLSLGHIEPTFSYWTTSGEFV